MDSVENLFKCMDVFIESDLIKHVPRDLRWSLVRGIQRSLLDQSRPFILWVHHRRTLWDLYYRGLRA